MNEKEYLAQRSAVDIVHDYITTLEEVLDHLGIMNGKIYFEEQESNEARNALAELAGIK